MNDKAILVTGGTGSFGKKFIKTVFEKYNPKKIIVYSRDELKQFDMRHSEDFIEYNKKNKIRFFIGNVRDLPRLKLAMNGVDIVIHTAALKQVPTAEYNPFETVKTNIMGGQNVIDAALSSGVSKVIALSTDKAAAPINLYGATKLTSDKLFVAANNYAGSQNISFSVVRYGNVMGSRGSVIPFFLERKKKKMLPITHKQMTRFNILLQEGVDFVIQCLERMWGGELFVPKVPSFRILDLAEAIAPNCKIEEIGIRPGEKINEEMITITDSLNTIEFNNYFVILPSTKLWDIEKFRLESGDKQGKYCEYGFSYNSGTNDHFLTVKELRSLIQKHVHP